jgi:hypothetical protein
MDAGTKAAALARELFPPSAKPLVWEVDQGDEFSQLIFGARYRVRELARGFFCSICTENETTSIQWCASLDEAKAFCESHHQQRFKELLA